MPDFDSRNVRLLIIDDNSPFVLPLMRSFSGYRNIHLDVLVSTQKPVHYFKYSRNLGELLKVNLLDSDNLLKTISMAVERLGSDMIIPTREWITQLLYLHKEEIEKIIKIHPLPDSETLSITGNKWNLNLWLRENGYPYSKTAGIGQKWSGDYPVLFKPVAGIGGSGIRMVDSASELEQELLLKDRYNNNYFIQEYVEGYDIDFSFLAIDGKILYHTIQKGLISSHMEYSKGIEFLDNDKLQNLAFSIIQSLKYTGIGHLDFRYNKRTGEYVLIDYNARYWSSVQGSRAMGINFPYLAVQYTLSQHVEDCKQRHGHYYFATTAFKAVIKNLISKSQYPIRLRDTQLFYLYKDPLPELMFLIGKILPPYRIRQ